MLKWLQKLMAGDQDAVPPDAVTERDEQGRVTRVTQTLTPPGSSGDAPSHPSLETEGNLAPRLAEACDWLVRQNLQSARNHGLGLERKHAFDQDTGLLTLKFGGRRKIVARAQILGSFDPRDRSFMWAWANPSIKADNCEDAARLKAEGERLGSAMLTIPVQTLAFDTLTPLLALGAQLAGADGVFRSMANGATSVFLTFHIEDAHGKGADPTPVDDSMIEAARVLAARYDAEMLPLDREYRERKNAPGILQELIERKMAVYRRYWTRDDDYWEPSSFGWPSDHDPDTKKVRFTVPHPDGGALDISIGEHVGQTVYRIEPIDDALRITDILIDWGGGFVWPKGTGSSSL